jgi:hypothetical protein
VILLLLVGILPFPNPTFHSPPTDPLWLVLLYGILADTLKPIDNALIGVQDTIQATKDITNGDITNGAIVIAGAISKKIL